MPFDREKMKAAADALASEGVFIGASSWKYPGWRGQLYHEDRYVWHGKFSEARFERLCLAEYAEVFKTVCVDAAYYKFPDHLYLEQLISQVPADFLFALKVTDRITIKHFSNLPRFGLHAGTRLIQEPRSRGDSAKGFIYVNNRLEGNALQTIAAMLEQAAG